MGAGIIAGFIPLFLVFAYASLTYRLKRTSEVYGAAYFINTQLLLTSAPLRAKIECYEPRKTMKESLKQNITLAEASYIFFHATEDWASGELTKNDDYESFHNTGDLPAQTRDVLDLSTLHLSWIERNLDMKIFRNIVGSRKNKESLVDTALIGIEAAMKDAPTLLRNMYSSNLRDTASIMNSRAKNQVHDLSTTEIIRMRQFATQEKLNSTVVVIPVVFAKGTSNSGATFRRRFFEIMLQSLGPFFDKIVVAVWSIEDRDYLLRLRRQGKVKIWDIFLLAPAELSDDLHCNIETGIMRFSVLCYAKRYADSSLAKGKLLPLASIEGMKRCMQAADAAVVDTQQWCPSVGLRPIADYKPSSLRYLYFTEADQVLLMRNIPSIYQWLDEYGLKGALVPHRLVPLSKPQKRQFRMSHKLRGTELNLDMQYGSQRGIRSVTFQESAEKSCCMSGGELSHDSSWVPITDPSLELFELAGIPTILGNHIHFNKTFHLCAYGERRMCS